MGIEISPEGVMAALGYALLRMDFSRENDRNPEAEATAMLGLLLAAISQVAQLAQEAGRLVG
jgi:hypothetical protein